MRKGKTPTRFSHVQLDGLLPAPLSWWSGVSLYDINPTLISWLLPFNMSHHSALIVTSSDTPLFSTFAIYFFSWPGRHHELQGHTYCLCYHWCRSWYCILDSLKNYIYSELASCYSEIRCVITIHFSGNCLVWTNWLTATSILHLY